MGVHEEGGVNFQTLQIPKEMECTELHCYGRETALPVERNWLSGFLPDGVVN